MFPPAIAYLLGRAAAGNPQDIEFLELLALAFFPLSLECSFFLLFATRSSVSVLGHIYCRAAMAIQRHAVLLIALFWCVLSHHPADSLPKSELLFPHGPAFGDRNLVNETDDFNSEEVELTTPIVFYGQNYTSIYVSSILKI